MTTTIKGNIKLAKPHEAQRLMLKNKKRFNVCCMGRRFGKTVVGSSLVAYKAVNGFPAAWFAPTYKLLLEAWRDIKKMVSPLIKYKSEHDKRIELYTDGVIDFWTLDGDDPARSRKYAITVIDEAAMTKDLLMKWNAAIRPTLMDYNGSAWFLSTPKGMGDFKDLFERSEKKKWADTWQSFKCPTHDNPYITREELASMEEELPDLIYQQEVLAEFVDFGGNLIKREHIIYEDFHDISRLRIAMGVDLAISMKETADYTAIVVMGYDSASGKIYIIDAIRVRVSFNDSLKLIKSTAERYNPDIIKIESVQFQAAVVQELLRTTRLPVSPCNTDKRDKVTRFRPLQVRYEQGFVRHSTGIAGGYYESELLSFTGNDKHDDLVDAAAYAYNGIDEASHTYKAGSKRVYSTMKSPY